MFRIVAVAISSLCFGMVGLIYIAPKKYIIPFLEKRNIISRKLTTSNEICITIDDSPGDSFEKIVTIANKHKVNLSFFVIEENVEKYKSIMEQEIKQNRHEFSNHGTTNSIAYFKSIQSLENEVKVCDDRLVRMSVEFNKVPVGTKYYRPGGGLFHKSMLNLIEKQNKRVVLGSVYPWDAQLPSCFWPIHLLYIKWKLEPGDIIILHDKPGTIKLLDYLLTWLNVHNWKVKPLAEFMKD